VFRSTFRHLAIAISEKHLASGSFWCDYGLEDTRFADTQATYSP